MRFNSRSVLRLIALALPALLPPAFAAEIGPFTGPEADAEAARLYEHANDFVNNVVEGKYSYAYMQFHWKRAGSNIDRIVRAYPSSPTAAQLKAGALKVGAFTPEYFKERVLPRLEEKKVASFDAINCAIFLYYLESNRDETAKNDLLSAIIQTLCRQIRWGEALGFPVLDQERPWLWNEVIRQTTIYHNDKLTAELLTNIMAEQKPVLLATVAEGLAFRGEKPADLEAFLRKEGDTPALRAAIFTGLARRELPIQRARALQLPLKGIYDGVDGVQVPEQSADLPAFLATIPAGPEQAGAVRTYARYLAALGRLAEARQLLPPAEHAALAFSYAGYLVVNEDYDQARALPEAFGLDAGLDVRFRLHLLELLAEYAPDKEAAAWRARLPAAEAATAVYREFHGLMFARHKPLVIREHSFSNLALTDPNQIGRLVCEWSLTPDRNLRGAAPWDAVVCKFAPGFAQLPPPKDKKKVEAAGR
jgi:hypothetical protein